MSHLNSFNVQLVLSKNSGGGEQEDSTFGDVTTLQNELDDKIYPCMNDKA